MALGGKQFHCWMSCDHDLANEWAHCGGKNASYITIHVVVLLISLLRQAKRLQNDVVCCIFIVVFVFAIHLSTVFTALQVSS